MEAYTDFASVYDIFMDETPYESWSRFLAKRLKEDGITDGIVLDLGCGTGNLTRLLARTGYDMIGVDHSEEMLNIAINKQQPAEQPILYLCQDMTEFELYGTVRAAVCVCDSLNYLLKEEQLLQTFKHVNNYLDPNGLFLFDFNTDYKYREVIGETVIAENRDSCSFIWENYYDEETCINEYDLTVFVKECVQAKRAEDVAGVSQYYRKFTETHYQRGYTLQQIKALVTQSGLIFIEALDADTGQDVTGESERICIIAREHGKQCDR